MFLLELAYAAYQARVRPESVQVPVSLVRGACKDVDLLPAILRAGRALLFARPARPGADAAMDQFEMRWHRTALGLMQGRGLYDDENEYIDAVLKRLRDGPSRLTDPRTLLARGVARAQADRHRLLQQMEGQEGSASINESLERFNDAARLQEVRAEARTRGAFLLVETGRSEEGLKWLQQIEPDRADPLLAYWTNVCRARALEAVRRPEDAEEAYRAALDAWPDAQVAEIGLAAVLMKRGKYPEALAMASAARTALVKTAEPLAAFEAADARFAAEWLRQLRQSLQ
jgi:tetratricopeptide (TPR) repeat protein